jgi:intracellular septation protein
MNKLRFTINALTELVPILAFVLVSEFVSFTLGLWVLIVTQVIALLISIFFEKRVPYFGLFAASTIFLFGGLSLYTNNPLFIMVKDSLYAFSFAAVIGVGLMMKKHIFTFFFHDFFAITEKGWHRLSLRWLFFFLLLGCSNEISRRVLSPEMWTLYKLLAVLLTWVFGFYQLTLTKKERLPEASEWGLRLR